MKLKSVIVSLVIGVLGAAPALAMPAFDEGAAREAIRQALEPWTGEEAGPGAIIQVAHRGAPVITDMVGYADLEHAVPITADTRFHAASISKQFTAYAIVRLSREGLVDLDASLAAYIPEAGIYRDVTVRDLLAHTHGIREWTSLVGASGFRQEDVVTNAHALALILRQQAMNAPPGESFSYSNSGFLLLAEIVERVTGQSLSDYSRELIFTPLGMDDTVFVDSLTMLVPDRAQSYVWTGEGYGRAAFNYAVTGSTGLTTTARDLAIWAAHLDRLADDEPAFYAAFHTMGVLNDGALTTYAYGQERRNYRGLETWSHGGRDAGYRAFLLRIPSMNLSISVLSNAADFDIAGTTFAIVDALLGSNLDPQSVETGTPSDEQLAAYEGDYELFPGLIFSLRAQDGTLGFALLGQEAFTTLPALSDHEFELNPVTGLAIVFDPDVDGPADRFLYRIGLLGVLPGSRIELEPFDRSAVELEDFEGTYYSAELSTGYDVVVEGGQLFARHPSAGRIALSPYQTDVFNSSNNFFQNAAFVRSSSGQVTGFRLSGAFMNGIVFDRVR